MAKRQKNRQYNGQKTEEQTIQWPKDRRTDNTMAKRQKNRQYNGQKKKTTIYKLLPRKQNIEQHELNKKRGIKKCSGRVAVPVPLVITPKMSFKKVEVQMNSRLGMPLLLYSSKPRLCQISIKLNIIVKIPDFVCRYIN
jgi:hypothetical protein